MEAEINWHGQRVIVPEAGWWARGLWYAHCQRRKEGGVEGAGLALWFEWQHKARDIKDTGSIPGYGRSHGEGNANSLQYSCLGNPMDRGAWQATVHGVTKSQTRLKWLSTHSFQIPFMGTDGILMSQMLLGSVTLSEDQLQPKWSARQQASGLWEISVREAHGTF